MGDVAQNLEVWNETWDWSQRGDEWSDWWGGTAAQWFGALLPRIHPYIPTGTILEIAPGYGRWTQYLKDLCDRLVVVDLAERCIDHCRERFASASNIEYHVNDGRSLAMVADESVDFVFSFDSLVHAEGDVLAAYLDQLGRKLKQHGVGFFHHSNAGAYPVLTNLALRTPDRFRRPLIKKGVLPDLYAWRAKAVTAESFASQCEAVGLACVAQEKINWGRGIYLTDVLSIFTRRGSRWERPKRIRRNPLFRWEARRMAALYANRS
jgi:SAM-dependent methyltransferase